MLLVDDEPEVAVPPVASDRGRSRQRTATRRVAARLAWREVTRRKGRTILVVLMIAAPVTAMTFGSIAVRTFSDPATTYRQEYGDTDFAMDWGPGTTRSDWPGGGEASQVNSKWTDVLVDVPSLDNTTSHTPSEPAPSDAMSDSAPGVASVLLILDDATPSLAENPVVRARVEILEGGWPGPGEALIPSDLANRYGLGVGDELVMRVPSGSWRVSGVARARSAWWSSPLVLDGISSDEVVADYVTQTGTYTMPKGTSVQELRQIASAYGWSTWAQRSDRGIPDRSGALSLVLVLGILGLALTGIVAAAAFATSVRRQLVTVGQLSANGADPKVVRQSLALQGTWSGLVGGVCGVFAGWVAWWLVAASRWNVTGVTMSATRYRLTDFAIVLGVGVIAATVAAAAPSRSVATTPTLTALAGRRPHGPPPSWLKPAGVGLTVGGLALVCIVVTSTSWVAAVAGVIGIVAYVLGVLCATPFIVELLGRLAPRVSLSPRLALRSMARAQIQSAAVIAAIVVTTGGAVVANAVAVTTLASDSRFESASAVLANPPAPTDTVIVFAESRAAHTPGVLAQVEAAVTTEFPTATITPLVEAVEPPVASAAPFEDGVLTYVADTTVLATAGLSATDQQTLTRFGRISTQSDLIGPNAALDTIPPTDPSEPIGTPGPTAADVGDVLTGPSSVPGPVDKPTYDWWSQAVLITPEQAARDQLTFAPGGLIVRVPGASIEELSAVSTIVDRIGKHERQLTLGYDFVTRVGGTGVTDPSAVMSWPYTSLHAYVAAREWDAQHARQVRIVRGASAALVLLFVGFVVAVAMSLAAAENRDEFNTMVAVGASPKSLRRQSVVRAVTIVLAGTVVGVPAGYIGYWILWNADREYAREVPLRFPGLFVLAVFVVIPAIIGAGTWVVSAVAVRRRTAATQP